RKVDRQPAAERAADKDRRSDIERLKHRLEIIKVAEFLVRAFRPAIAAPVVGNGAPAHLGRQSHLLLPHAVVADAGVQKHDGQSLAERHAGQHGATRFYDKGFAGHGSAPMELDLFAIGLGPDYCSTMAQKRMSYRAPNQHPGSSAMGANTPSSTGPWPGRASAQIR